MKKQVSIFSIMFILLACFFSAGCNEIKLNKIFVDNDASVTIVDYASDWSSKNIIVMGQMSDGSEILIDSNQCNFSDINTTCVGRQILTITYKKFKTEVEIEVKNTIDSISVNGIPNSVYQNQELTLDETQVEVNYSNGNKEAISSGFIFKQNNKVVESADTSNEGIYELEVYYAGKSAIVEYEVKTYVENITFYKTPINEIGYKKDYPFSSLSFTLLFSNGNETVINYSNDLFICKGLDTSKLGKQTIILQYNGGDYTRDIEFDVEVVAELDRIEYISGLPERLKYGMALPATAMANAFYTDGSVVNGVDGYVTGNSSPENKEGSNLNDFESPNIVISYTDRNITKSANVEVIIYEELEGIEVRTKNEYDTTILVDTEFDFSNVIVLAKYTKNIIDVSNDVVFGSIDTSTVGDKELSITYFSNLNDRDIEKEVQLTISVVYEWKDAPNVDVASIEIISGVEDIVLQNESIDLSQMRLLITYTNGETSEIDYFGNENEISYSFNSISIGFNTLTVFYKGSSANKGIKVISELYCIEVYSESAITTVKYGEALDLSNVEIDATYSDVSLNRKVEATNDSEISFNCKQLGLQTITFSYTDVDSQITKTCTMDVKVVDYIVELVVSNVVATVSLNTQYKTQDVTAIVIYASGTEKDLKSNELQFSDIDTSIEGEQILEISYAEDDCTLVVKRNVTVK